METNINCERLQDQYSDYFEHVLSPTEVETFERHLAGCDACRSDYHTFATMFQFLDRVDVEEVDAPVGLRADILSAIANKPAISKTPSFGDWLYGVLVRPQTMWGAGLAVAACVVVLIAVTLHGPVRPNPGTPNAISSNLVPGGSSSPQFTTQTPSPFLQNVVLKQGTDGADYEVFTLHTPQSMSTVANVNAYVLQDGGPVADATMESDPDKATPAWTGSLEPNVSLSLPVTVTSDLPAGTSLNLLLDWKAQDGSASGREVAFVPITAASSTPAVVPADSSFYDAVRSIAGEYQQTIVADNNALSYVPNAPPLSATTGDELNAQDALESVLMNDGFTVTVEPGGYYLISHP